MIKKLKLIFIMILTCTLIIGSTGCSSSDSDVTRVVLDWTPNTNHTGMFVALEKGWYEEVGLQVEIMQPPEETALSLLAAGNCEFAVGFQESMGPSFASSSPLPVTAIAAIIQHNTSGIMSLKETDIQSPKDLMDKRYGSWGSEFVNAVMKSIVEADGGDFEKIEMIPNNATDAISALQVDIDALWVYYAWDVIAAQIKGVDVNYISLQDYVPELDFYTPVLVSSDQYIASNPDKVRSFLEATTRGYMFAIENPDEAAEILLKHAPELDEDLVIASQKWLAGEYQADATVWGVIDENRWKSFYDWQFSQGLLDKEIGAHGFTNEFLPQQ